MVQSTWDPDVNVQLLHVMRGARTSTIHPNVDPLDLKPENTLTRKERVRMTVAHLEKVTEKSHQCSDAEKFVATRKYFTTTPPSAIETAACVKRYRIEEDEENAKGKHDEDVGGDLEGGGEEPREKSHHTDGRRHARKKERPGAPPEGDTEATDGNVVLEMAKVKPGSTISGPL